MKNFLVLAAVFAVAYANQDDYLRWVSYDGTIPDNAVPAGEDANNNTIYIGRVYLNTNTNQSSWNYTTDAKGYVPGNLREGVVSLDTVLFQKVHTATEGIEILTVVNGARIEWKFVKNYQFPQLFDTEAYHVARVGWEYEGMEFNSTTYLGTVNFNDQPNIGKIFNAAVLWAENHVLYFPSQGTVLSGYSYYALVYYY
ncbi:uncharacterized protein LOC114338959 [Diabrotica virgifera virgifera]|uniref:Uncharacterized protein LOC114338959 n=1 Tax=Diabrotica virgifera virgifera TaxID=50390 RepID=A0A6P7GNL5_DIAVI|nr:uncharacterized protein LOC114338959 [Diabrotica virgifera virgifera]